MQLGLDSFSRSYIQQQDCSKKYTTYGPINYDFFSTFC